MQSQFRLSVCRSRVSYPTKNTEMGRMEDNKVDKVADHSEKAYGENCTIAGSVKTVEVRIVQFSP